MVNGDDDDDDDVARGRRGCRYGSTVTTAYEQAWCDSGHAFAEMKRTPVAAVTASRGLEPWPSDGTALTRQGKLRSIFLSPDDPAWPEYVE